MSDARGAASWDAERVEQSLDLARRVIRDNGPADVSDEGKLARAVVALEARVSALSGVLEDLARTGVRADLNPTRYFGVDASVVDEYQWWCGYISRADASVRSRARAALGVEGAPAPEHGVAGDGQPEAREA